MNKNDFAPQCFCVLWGVSVKEKRGTNMKRYQIAGMLCLLFSLLLCACSAPPELVTGESSVTGESESEVAEISLTPVTPFLGADDTVSSKGGFYELTPNPQKGSNIVYIDYATKAAVYLCSRPECQHNDETCPSWFPFSTGYVFLDAKNKHLFCVGRADSEQEQTEVIWKMDANGENREKLYTCSPNENLIDMVVSDGSSLYFATGIVDSETWNLKKTLKQVNIESGKAVDLMTYQDAEWLFGAFEDELLVLFFDGKSFRYDAYSPETKNSRTLLTYDGNALSRPWGDSIYLVQPLTDSTAEVLKFNMKTMEKVSLCKDVPYFGGDTAMIEDIVDGRIVMYASDTRENDPEKIKRYHYAIDCATGEMTDLPLTYPTQEATDFVKIVADAGEFFVVNSGMEMVKAVLNGPDGAPYETEISTSVYSMISKSDYWSGQPNYIEIDNSAIAG